MAEVFGAGQLKSKSGLVSAADALKGKKVVVVYFSAHWCPPCRSFTPMLKDFYEEIIEKHGEASLAIIFVSSDRSEQDQDSYFNDHHGDWFAAPFGDAAAAELDKKCNVSGIPKLVVVNSKGDPLKEDARNDVSGGSPNAAYQKWLALQ